MYIHAECSVCTRRVRIACYDASLVLVARHGQTKFHGLLRRAMPEDLLLEQVL